MCDDKLGKIVAYVYTNFTEPKSYWSDLHFLKRCCEIRAGENAILTCMESNEDNQELLENLYMYYDMMFRTTNDKCKKIFKFQRDAIDKIIANIK